MRKLFVPLVNKQLNIYEHVYAAYCMYIFRNGRLANLTIVHLLVGISISQIINMRGGSEICLLRNCFGRL